MYSKYITINKLNNLFIISISFINIIFRVFFVVIILSVVGLPCIEYLVTNQKILDFRLYSALY